jgi:predicted transcriptional regulator
MSSEPSSRPAQGPRDTADPANEPDVQQPRELTDAKAMRALAHPLRMELLDLFGFHQTLTATEASELLGESPANCAFHLRTLAKYGFIQEAGGGRGRERPWTLVDRSVRITSHQADPQAALAATELGRVLLDRWLARARKVFGSENQVPGWDEASGWSHLYAFLTPEETEALMKDMRRLLQRYEARTDDPAARPPGAQPVDWAIFAAPVAEWPGPGGESAPGVDQDGADDGHQ